MAYADFSVCAKGAVPKAKLEVDDEPVVQRGFIGGGDDDFIVDANVSLYLDIPCEDEEAWAADTVVGVAVGCSSGLCDDFRDDGRVQNSVAVDELVVGVDYAKGTFVVVRVFKQCIHHHDGRTMGQERCCWGW